MRDVVHDEAAPALRAQGIGKAFSGRRVLEGVNLSLQRGEVVALLGPSGCGKTTLLRMVAGLLDPDAGRIEIAGREMADGAARRSLPPEARGLGMVFQDYALWPHLTVAGNVAFPLEMRGIARAEREARVARVLARVGLDAFARRQPGTLSGGQQQRVALARALVAEPPLILFDEPLSNLDKELRESLAHEIATLLRESRTTALYVTHDQGEAFAVADRVAVMQDGRILQDAPPETLFARPADPAVARFLNLGALVVGVIADGVFRHAASRLALRVELPDGPAEALLPRRALQVTDGPGLAATITEQRFRGDDVLITAALPDGTLLHAAHPRRLSDSSVHLDLAAEAVTVFAGGAARPATALIPQEA